MAARLPLRRAIAETSADERLGNVALRPILLKKAPGRSSGPKMSNILARRWPGMGNYSALHLE
jgi:hypothetical protein